MNLTLLFSRKCRWTEHYFFVAVQSLENPQKLLKTNQVLVSTIFFTIMNISFFSLRFDLFSIIAKEVNQIRNNVVCVVACFLVLLCTHYGPLQCFSTYFRKLKEIGVLWPIFPDYVISCDYGDRHYHENVKGMMMGMIKHSQSTQSKKFAMFLQCFF